jgi:hypothetical protein
VRPACNGRVSCSTAFPKPQIPQGPLIIKKPRCISSCCGCVCRCAPKKKPSPSSLNWLFPRRPHPGSDLFCRRCIRRFAFTRRRCSRGQPSRTSQTHKETFFCGTPSGRRKMGVLRRPHSTHSYLAAKIAAAADDGCGYRDLALYGSIALARINSQPLVAACAHAKAQTEAARFFASRPGGRMDERIDSLSLG